MGKIVGLDISTAVTGVSVLNEDGTLNSLTYVDTREIDDMWKTADAVSEHLLGLAKGGGFAALWVEEDLQRFRRGMSSAHTLSTLTKINGVVTYAARTIFGVEPEYIQSSAARKKCGIKIVKPSNDVEKNDPYWTKRQVFEQMTRMHPELAARDWEKTRPSKQNPEGRLRSECYDMVDAYVISHAGLLTLRDKTRA